MAYESAFREARRLLEQHTDLLQKGELSTDGQFDSARHQSVENRITILLEKMAGEVTDESQRLGAWGVIGEGSGGQIVRPGTRTPITAKELFGKTADRFHSNL